MKTGFEKCKEEKVIKICFIYNTTDRKS